MLNELCSFFLKNGKTPVQPSFSITHKMKCLYIPMPCTASFENTCKISEP